MMPEITDVGRLYPVIDEEREAAIATIARTAARLRASIDDTLTVLDAAGLTP